MNLNTAYALVVEDVRRSFPDMAYDEAVAHVYNTVSLRRGVVGASWIGPDNGTELWDAYLIVLRDQDNMHAPDVKVMVDWMASQTDVAGILEDQERHTGGDPIA